MDSGIPDLLRSHLCRLTQQHPDVTHDDRVAIVRVLRRQHRPGALQAATEIAKKFSSQPTNAEMKRVRGILRSE